MNTISTNGKFVSSTHSLIIHQSKMIRFVVASALLLSTGIDGFAFTPATTVSRRTTTTLQASDSPIEHVAKVAATLAVSLSLFATPAFADGQTKDFRLPPIDFSDKSRCVLNGSKMGQANAARDKLYDLRMCDLAGKDASSFDLSGVIMTKTNLSNAKLVEAQISKGYLHESNFDGADFTNGIIDRASFKGSSLRGAIFTNAVLTGTVFTDADLENSDFTETAIGDFDLRALCKNPSLKGENPVTGVDTFASAGCEGLKKQTYK